jgi:glucose/arabinose dehydrogenase
MQTMSRYPALVLGLVLALIAGKLAAEDLTTSFEFDDLSGEFTLGESPLTVTFTGGEAKSIGNFALYHTGTHAFMVTAGGIGTVTFETPAREITLFLRDESSSVGGVLTVFDTDGTEIESFDSTDASWTEVSITRDAAATPIGSITLVHNGASGHTVIDDFSFCAVEGGLDDPIPAPIEQSDTEIGLRVVAAGLTAPNWGTYAPLPRHLAARRLFVTDQAGILWAIDTTGRRKRVFLDVSDRLVELGAFGPGTFDERGLLGVAFHPAYADNGLLFTYTSEPVDGPADFSTLPPEIDANHQTVITEWQVPAPHSVSSVVDPGTARVLLRIDQPQFNHDGGALAFGPDDLLYISLGDGGGADDQGGGHGAEGNGQDPSNPLGSILRIDPLGSNSANGQYGIPLDNPFVGQMGVVEEIFAYGLRNPFRFSFDRASGLLIVADVGQNDIEEIDGVFAGDNLGWNIKEGSFCFNPNGDDPGFVTECVAAAGATELSDPIAEYDHDEGIAVIGGFVYRGHRVRELFGRYIFGDFARTFDNDGRLFILEDNLSISELQIRGRDGLQRFLLGFGQDAAGEIYVMVNSTGVPFGSTGVVLKIVPSRLHHGF